MNLGVKKKVCLQSKKIHPKLSLIVTLKESVQNVISLKREKKKKGKKLRSTFKHEADDAKRLHIFLEGLSKVAERLKLQG